MVSGSAERVRGSVGSLVRFPRSTSHSDDTLNRGPRLRITFLCWWEVKPSSLTHSIKDLSAILSFFIKQPSVFIALLLIYIRVKFSEILLYKLACSGDLVVERPSVKQEVLHSILWSGQTKDFKFGSNGFWLKHSGNKG